MKKFLTLSTFLFLLSTIAPPSAGASCWCSDATYCTCANTKTTDYHINRNVGMDPKTKVSQVATIYCDSQAELDSEFRQAMPVCGGSPEILPYCAYKKDSTLPDGIDTHSVTCYGIEFFKGTTNIPKQYIPENKLQQMNGPIRFIYTDGSTKEFGGSGTNELLWCNSIAFCCARSDIQCSDEDVPKVTADSYCTANIPTPPNQTKASSCTPPSGAGESRLWFTQLRNISALSTLLQSIFNPAPSSFNKNAEPPAPQSASLDNPAAVTTRIQLHQGLDDNTQYVSNKNNSSLKVNQPAPDPLYSFNDPSLPYKASGFCSIADTRANPGDDLLGPAITARLIYTQKYQYQAAASLNCFGDSAYVSKEDQSKCCSFKAAGIPAIRDGVFPGTTEERYKCGTLPGVREKTQGRIAVFTKTPLIEYIYNTLVVGPQSVIKRLFPLGNPTEFKEIPSSANYSATAPDADQMLVGGQTGQTPTIYFPHVGSLYEYFLQGLQKALRPLGWTFSSSPPPVLSGDCNTVAAATTSAPACPSGASLPFSYACGINSELKTIIQEAGGAYGVPPAIIAGILSIETRNGVFGVSKDQVALHNTYGAYTPYLCQPNACGAMGAMQLLTGYGVQPSCSQAVGINNWAKYSCTSGSENPNPGNLRDTIFAGAKMIKVISGTAAAQNSNWSQNTVTQVAKGYYGVKDPDPNKCGDSFNLKANIEYANSCIPVPPVIVENDMTYCDYLWYYYSPRR